MSVTSYLQEASAITARFAERWGDLTPVAWDDQGNETPGSTEGYPYLTDWVRFAVYPATANTTSIGGPRLRYRHAGEVVIEIYAVPGQGPHKALSLADTACGIYRAWETPGLRFYAPRIVRVGNEGGWYRVNVIAPYQRDSLFSVEE